MFGDWPILSSFDIEGRVRALTRRPSPSISISR